MRSFLLTISICLLSTPAAVHAQALASAQRIGRYVELIVDDTGNGQAVGHFDFTVNEAVTTIVLFPEDIQEGDGVPDPYFNIAIKDHKAAISTTRRSLKRGIQRNVMLSSDNISASFLLTPTETPSDAVALAVVRRRSEVERWQAEYEAYAATRDGQREHDAQRRSDRATLDFVLEMRPTPVQPKTVLGDMAPRARGVTAVTIANVEGVWSGPNKMIVKFEMENTGTTPFEWAESQIYGQDRRANHAREARIGMPAEPGEGLVGRLPAGERAHAAILVERAREISGPMTIILGEQDGGRPVMVTVGNWIPMQSVQNIQMMELRPVEPPDPERDKVSLHLQAVYGAVWLGDGAGLEKSDATSLAGLGVRAQYSFNRWLAFEGEVMGAGTGSAHFEGVTFEGEQGDLTRSARLGRAQFGGVLRFGQGTYVPLARLGVGLQGASHRGTLTTATGEAPGPDAFEWTTFATFGTGLDIRMDDFRAGIALTAIEPRENEMFRRSIEAGIHLGYAWKP